MLYSKLFYFALLCNFEQKAFFSVSSLGIGIRNIATATNDCSPVELLSLWCDKLSFTHFVNSACSAVHPPVKATFTFSPTVRSCTMGIVIIPVNLIATENSRKREKRRKQEVIFTN